MNNLRDIFIKRIIVLFTVLVFSVSGLGQSANSYGQESVSVKSWKTGSSRVREQALSLTLEKDLNEYEFDIYDTDKLRHFRLRLRQDFMRTIRKPSIPCWVAVLREVTKDNKTGGNILSYNLFSTEGPGVGDTLEGLAIYFCPVEKPEKVFDGGLYPIKAERKFLVEKFLVIFKVSDYQLNEKENRLDTLDLKVEFKNQE
jgi:hypothetical protein